MFNLNDGLLNSLTKEVITITEEWQAALIIGVSGVLVMIVSYLLGSVNSAIIISKAMFGDDIRTHGSGNAGLTNMLRTYGKAAAGLTLLGDMLKAVLSIIFAGIIFGFGYYSGISLSDFCYVAGLFAVIGHIFPIYYGFRINHRKWSLCILMFVYSSKFFIAHFFKNIFFILTYYI